MSSRPDQVIADLNAALELTPQDPQLYTLRGQVYLSLYEWDKALADFNQALDLDPNDPDAYFYRGLLYTSILQTGVEYYPRAAADFQRYLELAPSGDHAEEAERYIQQLQDQTEALGGSS